MYTQTYEDVRMPVSRRLSGLSEVELSPAHFGQPVDIELTLATGERELTNMPGYPRRSVQAAIGYIETCIALGLSKFLIRIVDGGDESKDTSFCTCINRIGRQAEILVRLREAFPEITIFVDPFGIALGSDDQWGARDVGGHLSLALTQDMFAKAVELYGSAGASYVLTLGRFPTEVEVARTTVHRLGSRLKICTFSTNMETTQAYSYLPVQEIYRDSGQKVLPQNVNEMIIWALADIVAGANMVIIKPSCNVHVLMRLMQLASCELARAQFLKLPIVSELSGRCEWVAKQMANLRGAKGPLEAEWGTYAISGVYAADMVEFRRKGMSFLLTRLHERFSMIAATAAQCGGDVVIFDRLAERFAAA